MRNALPCFGVSALLAACVTSSSAPPAVPPAASLPDACAADAPWLVAILGELPSKSDSLHLDRGARDPNLAIALARGQGREVDGDLRLMRTVTWSSLEVYEYDQQGTRTQSVRVYRNVSGKDPRTLGDIGEPPLFGNGTPLRSGVVEYPANPAAGADDAKVLFVFPDATWMMIEPWMEPRFRVVLDGSNASPPLPPGPNDVYVEYCMPQHKDQDDDGSKTGGITPRGADHVSMRFKVGQIPAYEMLYTFATPALAASAEAEQRQRCATQKCSVVSGSVEGRLVRYVLR